MFIYHYRIHIFFYEYFVLIFFFRHRGKLINFNEFKSDNTLVELIDVGTFYQTKLEKLYILPYFLYYDPLVSKTIYIVFFFFIYFSFIKELLYFRLYQSSLRILYRLLNNYKSNLCSVNV